MHAKGKPETMRDLFFVPPVFGDREKTRAARLLFLAVWIGMAALPLSLFATVALPQTAPRGLAVIVIGEISGLVLLTLNRRGHTRLAGVLTVVLLWGINTALAFAGGGMHSNAVAVYLLVVFLAGLLLGGPTGVIAAVLCSVAGGGLLLAEAAGMLPFPAAPPTAYPPWLAMTMFLFILAGLQSAASRMIREASPKSRRELAERGSAERSLREAEEKYRLVVDHAGEAILVAQDGVLRYVNPVTSKILGYTGEELTSRPLLSIIYREDREKVVEAHRRIVQRDKRQPVYQFRVVCKDGSVKWADGHAVVISWEGNPATLHFFTDTTDRKRAEREQNRSREIAHRLAEETAIIAEIGRIISSTINIEEVYGRFAAEVKKIIPFDRIVISIINTEKHTMTNVYTAGIAVADRKVGDVYPLEGSGNLEMLRTKACLLIQTESFDEYKDRFPLLLSTFQAGFRSILHVPLFSKGEIIGGLLLRSLQPYAYTDKHVKLAERVGNQIAGTIVNAQMFMELQRMEREIREMSLRDHLTDLYNRRGFVTLAEQQLKAANRSKRRMMLAFLDVDGLKGINDRLGHEEGDRALTDTANILRQTFRESDIIARIGGDEFAVLTIEMAECRPDVFSQRLQKNIEAWNAQGSRPYTLGMSWGSAVYDPESPMSLDRLMSASDERMYARKKAKGGGHGDAVPSAP